MPGHLAEQLVQEGIEGIVGQGLAHQGGAQPQPAMAGLRGRVSSPSVSSFTQSRAKVGVTKPCSRSRQSTWSYTGSVMARPGSMVPGFRGSTPFRVRRQTAFC